MDISQLITLLAKKESEAIIRTLAMMSYNPSIGRVLEQEGVDKFSDLMVERVPKLTCLATQEEFDAEHTALCNCIIASFKTARDEAVKYGPAQKPVNVFLKVYVDWAGQPGVEHTEKLKPWLHVPLDSLLMKYISREFPEEYRRDVGEIREQLINALAARIPEELPGRSDPRALARQALGNEFALSAMNEQIYSAWQSLLRSLYPARPILLDVVWVLERNRTGAE